MSKDVIISTTAELLEARAMIDYLRNRTLIQAQRIVELERIVAGSSNQPAEVAAQVDAIEQRRKQRAAARDAVATSLPEPDAGEVAE